MPALPVHIHKKLFRYDVSGRRQEAAGLALQRQVLGVELPGGEHGDREEAANSEFVDGAKIHFVFTPWSAVPCLR